MKPLRSGLNEQMNVMMIPGELTDLYSRLSSFFNTYPLSVAGRFLGWNPEINCIVLYAQTTGGITGDGTPKDWVLRDKVYADIPEDIRLEMERRGVGFALQPLVGSRSKRRKS